MSDWMPERRLWQSVVNQALHDACNEAWREELHRREALHFLLDKTGNWKKSRDTISDVCNYAPEYLYEKTIKMMQTKSDKRINGKQWRVYPEHKRT